MTYTDIDMIAFATLSAVGGAGVGFAIARTGFPHRHRFKPTGHWVPVAGGILWFLQECAGCKQRRIITSVYQVLRFDDVDELRLRRGEWRYDERILDAKDFVEVLIRG